MLAALEAEVAGYVEAFADQLVERGRRLEVATVTRSRVRLTTAAGAIPVRPLRGHPQAGRRVAEVLPLLYLHGLSSGDFGAALAQFLGSGVSPSAAAVTRLTKDWQADAAAFNKRSLETDYVCVWVGRISRSVSSRTRCAC